MALVKCPECKNLVSTTAKKCPACGAKVVKPIGWVGKFILLSLVASVIVSSILESSNSQPTNEKKETTQIKPPALAVLEANFNKAVIAQHWVDAKNISSTLQRYYPDSEATKLAISRKTDIDAKVAVIQERHAADVAQAQAAQKRKVAATLQALRKHRDEVNSVTFYRAPEVAEVLGNLWELYIGIPDSGTPYLRCKYVYMGDNWLFIQGITMKIDDQKLPDVPVGFFDMHHDNNAYEVWEWHDEGVHDENIAFFEKLARSKKTIIRYEGRDHIADQVLSEREKKGMRRILDTYALLKSSAGPLPE